MATTPFRTTPILGPGLTSAGPNYWDTISPDVAMPSYQPGMVVQGNDGITYTYVTAGEDLSEDARVNLDAAFEARANASGTHVIVADVTADNGVHVKPYVA